MLRPRFAPSSQELSGVSKAYSRFRLSLAIAIMASFEDDPFCFLRTIYFCVHRCDQGVVQRTSQRP
jgi:hypothetical protein